MGTNQVMGLRELLSAYSLRFVDWLEKVVQPDPKDRYPDAEAAFNAFKPLYVKRVPEAIVSSSVVEFTASKLGERITQTLMVRNNVPETVLEGWWEVAPHPSDPPHTPNSHAWISFGSRKFSGNANECSIVVNTDKLMAGKVYNRKILLHSNSSEKIEELDLTARTAEVPIQSNDLNWNKLISFFLITIIITAVISMTVFGYGLYGRQQAAKVAIAIICVISFILFGLISGMNSNQELKIEEIALTVLSGFFITLFFVSGFQGIWFPAAITSISVLTKILVYPIIKRKKLVSKYRDLEEGLIKP